jgi:hypothetical protein
LSGYELFGLRVLVTFAVSVVSFHLVERPIRMGTFISQWRAWLVVPASVGAVLVAVIAATAGTSAVASTALPGGVGNTGTGSGSSSATTSTTAPPSAAGPPVKVLLFGDSVALTLGLGLGEQNVQDKYDYQLTDKGILGCGVVDGPQVELMGTRYDTPQACGGSGVEPGGPAANEPWQDQWRSAISQDAPNVVVLLAGRWEVVDREDNGTWTNILHPAFAAYVKSQLEQASQLVTATGSHMVFLTGPCTDGGEQPDGAPWPEDNAARLAVYNKLVREVAAEHATTDSAVNLFGAACPGGKFASTVHGVTIRQTDGVHFTVAGGQYLAPTLMPAIVAAGRAQMAAASTTTTTAVSAGG